LISIRNVKSIKTYPFDTVVLGILFQMAFAEYMPDTIASVLAQFDYSIQGVPFTTILAVAANEHRTFDEAPGRPIFWFQSSRLMRA
jgi:hypothetical protein